MILVTVLCVMVGVVCFILGASFGAFLYHRDVKKKVFDPAFLNELRAYATWDADVTNAINLTKEK